MTLKSGNADKSSFDCANRPWTDGPGGCMDKTGGCTVTPKLDRGEKMKPALRAPAATTVHTKDSRCLTQFCAASGARFSALVILSKFSTFSSFEI